MNKAVFLDRDGVINRERGYVHRVADFELLPDVARMLRIFRERGFLLIVVTNQTGIGKGYYKQKDVESVHGHMIRLLAAEQVHLDEIYYCIHHPDSGRCICRKPSPLFVEKALARFNIDPAGSYFIGDKEHDVLAGEAAGVKGILIRSDTSLCTLESVIV
ncbi:MAG: histidinol-phosphate phosphatase family protein [Bacteroidetes bacterium]|nr:MAG: histidinol-phosphate phosphatase family protein [Bacteroidota bacterium]